MAWSIRVIEPVSLGKLLWALGIVAWYVIRYPFERRAKRVKVVHQARSPSENIGLGCALLGLGVVPGIYAATGFPEAAEYPTRYWVVLLGGLVFAAGLAVFRWSHKALGRNWSITLEIREKHRIVSSGPYKFVRHPMYLSFLLMGLGQALLLPNWISGMAGIVGFAVLFFLRVDKEERMMQDGFGPEYEQYMRRTKKIIPFLY